MYEKKAQSLSQLEEVEEVVFSSPEGMVLIQSGKGDPEEAAALIVFVAQMAAKVGEALKWGDFEKGTFNGRGERVLIYNGEDHRLGIFVKPQASISLVEDRVEEELGSRGER
jgi:predicted regulator of Ras-like GTPase activity (Roadblock/LC7/MglB family)